MVPVHDVAPAGPRTTPPADDPPPALHQGDLSDDARVLLRLISHRTRLHSTFTAGDVMSSEPAHQAEPGGPAAVPMDQEEVTLALGELSQDRGWLASFRPGSYVFRALAPDGPETPMSRRNTGRFAAGGRGQRDGHIPAALGGATTDIA